MIISLLFDRTNSTTLEPIYINGARRFFSKLSVISFRTISGVHCGLLNITQRNLNSSAQQNRFNNSRIQENSSVFIAFCKVHLRSFGFKDDPEGFVQYPLRISTVDYYGGRIAFHFS